MRSALANAHAQLERAAPIAGITANELEMLKQPKELADGPREKVVCRKPSNDNKGKQNTECDP